MYRNTFRFFLTPVALLTVLRVVLKLLFVDTATGFFSGGSILPVVYSVVAAASLVGLLIAVIIEKDNGIATFKGNRTLEIAGIVLGIVVLAVNGLHLANLLSEPLMVFEVNVMPRPIRLVCYVLGVVSGIVLMWTAASSLSGASQSKKAGLFSLVVCVWHALYTVGRFITFRQASTVSDQFIETIYFLCGIYFWLGHAKCVANVDPPRKRIILSSLSAILFGIPLVAGQLSAVVVLGEVSGPAFPELLLITASCVYFAVFAMAAASSPTLSCADENED